MQFLLKTLKLVFGALFGLSALQLFSMHSGLGWYTVAILFQGSMSCWLLKSAFKRRPPPDNLKSVIAKWANTMVALEKAHEQLMHEPGHQENDSFFVNALAIKITLNNVTARSVEFIKQHTEFHTDDSAVDFLINLFPGIYNIYSIRTHYNVDYDAQTCAEVYARRHGQAGHEHLDVELEKAMKNIYVEYDI